MNGISLDQGPIRDALKQLDISPRVQPNETIDIRRVYFPNSHRGVLDTKRQLIVGNRGMGKSFWTHALTNPQIRQRLASTYSFPALAKTTAVLGFNGSLKLSPVTPTIDEIHEIYNAGENPETIWRAVVLRAVRSLQSSGDNGSLEDEVARLKRNPRAYSEELTAADNASGDTSILVVFDALDRLSQDWATIRKLTKGLLVTILGLQSFRCVRAKVFLRVDQFSDPELFRFQDSSKLRNDYVDLGWDPHELYGLLLFELLRQDAAAAPLKELAAGLEALSALPADGKTATDLLKQQVLITALAGEFMGSSSKRGRVYTWVPLHLSDAANNCSPRTFLTAWRTASEHTPIPQNQAVDHFGLSEGVRRASKARLTELSEDFPWISLALEPLRSQLVPLERESLFSLWEKARVIDKILEQSQEHAFLAPIGIDIQNTPEALLKTMTSIAVMEERTNGKINVPDIFRVEAGILRKGGVAVPHKK